MKTCPSRTPLAPLQPALASPVPRPRRPGGAEVCQLPPGQAGSAGFAAAAADGSRQGLLHGAEFLSLAPLCDASALFQAAPWQLPASPMPMAGHGLQQNKHAAHHDSIAFPAHHPYNSAQGWRHSLGLLPCASGASLLRDLLTILWPSLS